MTFNVFVPCSQLLLGHVVTLHKRSIQNYVRHFRRSKITILLYTSTKILKSNIKYTLIHLNYSKIFINPNPKIYKSVKSILKKSDKKLTLKINLKIKYWYNIMDVKIYILNTSGHSDLHIACMCELIKWEILLKVWI